MPEVTSDGVPRSSVAHDRYRTLFERVNASAFLAELSGRILEANHHSAEFLGYEHSEVLRLSLRDILPEETDWAWIRDELAARGGLNVETQCVCKDGLLRPVEVSLSVFRMEGQISMFVLLWDIQERRTAEQRLKESEKKYRGLFEFATDGIIVLDAHGDIVDVNTRICELLDICKQEMVGKNLFGLEVLTARSMPVVVSQFEQLLLEKKAGSYTSEIQTTGGEIREVEISSFFLVKKDNEVDNFVLSFRDITARNEAERTRTKEHELFRTLLDNVPDSVYFKDAEHRFILVNKAKAEHAHLRMDQMIGKTDADIMPVDVAAVIRQDDEQVLLSGVPLVNKVEHLVDAAGGDRWVMVTKIPRYSADGDVIGTMGISRDITEWRLAEQRCASAQEQLQVLLDVLPEQVCFKDLEHRFVVVNAAMARVWKTTPEEVRGKTAFEVLSREQAQRQHDDECGVLSSGVPVMNRVDDVVDAFGVRQRYATTIVPRMDAEGGLVGTLTICRIVP